MGTTTRRRIVTARRPVRGTGNTAVLPEAPPAAYTPPLEDNSNDDPYSQDGNNNDNNTQATAAAAAAAAAATSKNATNNDNNNETDDAVVSSLDRGVPATTTTACRHASRPHDETATTNDFARLSLVNLEMEALGDGGEVKHQVFAWQGGSFLHKLAHCYNASGGNNNTNNNKERSFLPVAYEAKIDVADPSNTSRWPFGKSVNYQQVRLIPTAVIERADWDLEFSYQLCRAVANSHAKDILTQLKDPLCLICQERKGVRLLQEPFLPNRHFKNDSDKPLTIGDSGVSCICHHPECEERAYQRQSPISENLIEQRAWQKTGEWNKIEERLQETREHRCMCAISKVGAPGSGRGTTMDECILDLKTLLGDDVPTPEVYCSRWRRLRERFEDSEVETAQELVQELLRPEYQPFSGQHEDPYLISLIQKRNGYEHEAAPLDEEAIAALNIPIVRFCKACSRLEDEDGPKLLTCSRCRMADFCNQKCQKDAWKWHKRECKPAK